MVTDPAFIAGDHTTNYLDDEFGADRIAEAVDRWSGDVAGDPDDGGAAEREFTVEVNDERFDVRLHERGATPIEDLIDDADAGGRSGPPGAAGPDAPDAGSGDAGGAAGDRIEAEMQGTILSVAVGEGDEIEAGDVVCVLEAMKMENDVIAEAGGTVTEVAVTAGDSVDTGDTLVVVE
jgi:acetyl-CoA/propionyl-CoA carboxylase biotin carboxyl carrier protein